MELTVEISFYPLREDYTDRILSFINRISSYEGLSYKVNGMSTQICGTYENVFHILQSECKEEWLHDTNCIFVLKMGHGNLLATPNLM